MMKTYGRLLRELRTRAGYSLTQTADRLSLDGISATNTQISRWENGYNNPSLEQFLGLCRIYGVKDLYRTFLVQDLSVLPTDLNRRGYELLVQFRDLLRGSKWYEKEKLPDRPQEEDAAGAAEEEVWSGPKIVILPLKDRIVASRLRQEAQHADEARVPSNLVPLSPLEPPALETDGVRENETGALETYEGPMIRCFVMPASAGTGTMVDSEDSTMIPLPEEVPQDVSFAVMVQGNSMEPLLHTGDLLYIRAQETLEDGEVGVMTLNDSTYVKQFRATSNGDWLVSVNPAYTPIRINEYDTFMIHGKVVSPGISRSLIPTPPQISDEQD